MMCKGNVSKSTYVITLKWVLLVITLTRVNADDTHGIEKRDTSSESKKVVCYYTNWSVYRPGTAKFTPQNINPYLCTHLIYAFGGLDKENGLRPFDKYQDIEQGGYAKFTGLKTYNKNLKTMLAIGGWNEGSSRFSNLVADDERRAAFVKNVVKFLRQNNFDGLDLDWEYPAFRDGSKVADKENYASLVKELREEFERESSKTGRPRLLLTMAVPAGIEYIDKGYDIPKLNRYLDFMNILSYDYHSAYEPNVNHHAPLYPLQEESEYNFDSHLTIDHTIKHYIKKGADPEKLILGIPTYGRSYTLFNPDSTDLGAPADGPGEQGEATREKGYLAYYEICGNVENGEWKIVFPKKSAMGPYAYRANQWVGYDDIDIVKEKAKFVNKQELGGIMFWSIDNDDFRGKCHGKQYPLIEAGKEMLLANNGTSSNTIAASTEEKRTKLGFRKNRPKQIHTTAKPQTSTTRTTTTTTTPSNPLSTPEPPTTPDPGTDFVCKEEGFFPHPRDCKKYFWCLDSGPSNLGIVAHQFTCPSGLLFNKAADSCDYSRNVICNKKSEKSSTTSSTTTKSTTTVAATKPGTTTTTTTSTESAVEEEYEEEEEEDAESQEDPKAIKQLITLIKKLGGISELEKQLNIGDGSKEATTPAISKNLYNKVFSGSANGRFKSQHRNAPPGPQNEGLSSNENVPYYRKSKPQYVTIQRSRPKNIPQDAEDSGTSNSKAIQLNADYADAGEAEEEVANTKSIFTTPRTRQTTAEVKTTSLRYVVLDRHRQNRTTTTESEEAVQESPSSTTQRYITLIRQRQRTTSNEPEEESPTTESSARATIKPASRSDKDEPVSERATEKVSEFENTTYAPTSPVTSAPHYITTTTAIPTQTTTIENSFPNTTTDVPHTFLVFPQTVIYENATKFADELTKATEQPEQETSTEPFTTSIATTVITTVRESATEITRIPLRMFREYFKKNRSDTFRHDLRSNVVASELKKHKESPYSNTEKLKTAETTTRRSLLSRKRVGYSPTPVSVTKASNQSDHTIHSRLFFRRNRTDTTTALTNTNPPETTPYYEKKDTTKLAKSSENDSSKHRYSKFRSRLVTPASTESKVGIRNFFQQKRQSTSTEQYSEVPLTTINPFSKPNSRYFSRSRKTTALDNASSKEYPVTTTRGRFLKDKFQRKTTSKGETLDSDENKRYSHAASSSTERSITDQITLSDSNEQPEIVGRNNTVRSIGEVKTTDATTDLPATTENSNTESRTDETTVYPGTLRSTTSKARHSLETSSEQPAYLRIAPRNNSRFLKIPDPEFQTPKPKETFARGHSRYASTTQLPVNAVPKAYQREFTAPSKRVNDIADGQSKLKNQLSKGRSLNFDNQNEIGGARGRHKYSDSPDSDSGNTQSTADGGSARNFDFRRRSRIHYSSPSDEVWPAESTTKRPVITNRGSIKAKNSLSKAEIKELANLVETSSGKTQTRKHHRTPINRIEENSNLGYEGLRKAPPSYRSSNDRLYSTVANQFVYDQIDPVFDFNERIYEDRTESYYPGGGKAPPMATDSNFNDIFRVSETKYGNDDVRRTKSTRDGGNVDNNRNVVEPSTKEAEQQSQVTIRQRGNFRRNNSSYSRSRSTTTPATTTAEYSSYDSNRLANRFKSRTRKVRPENRSINTARSENFIPLSETETSTVIRHKNNDISQRGSTRISDYLPIPAPLYRLNHTVDQLGANNINLDDVESQTISTPVEYSTDDISDLANPLVAAISNLKTAPPASSQTVFAKTVSPYSPPSIFTQTVAPYSPPISYTKELPEQFHIVKSTPRTITASLYQQPKSNRRGGARHSARTSTTTQLPSLQDIYNDYPDPETEFHAEPVDIPITGKVRIHSDGYIECLDMGNFPHPYSCKKFISCAKMEYNSLLGWEYTCPKGLSFDPIGGICNWSAGLGCKE